MSMVPRKKIITRTIGNGKVKCDGCNKEKRTRNIVMMKGQFLCNICRTKRPTFRLQSSACQIGRPMISLNEALEKTYSVKKYYNRISGAYQYNCSFPSILVGHRVIIKLIEETDNEKVNDYIKNSIVINGGLHSLNRKGNIGIQAINSFPNYMYDVKFKLELVR